MTKLVNQNRKPSIVDTDYVAKYGERALPFAPQVSVLDEVLAVPQQFLAVSRSLSQLETILERIETIEGYLLFAGLTDHTLYLQVGIIGQENYPLSKNTHGVKIVYGRRWLIEDSTPTSEVIQTALLAVQKAREHELREKLIIEFDKTGHRATPFNSHQDTPLMARVESTITLSSQDTIEQALSKVIFDERRLDIVSVESICDTVKVAYLRLDAPHKLTGPLDFPELDGHDIIVCFKQTYANAILHELTEQLITMSNRYVAENFRFGGFKRFSHKVNPIALAKFSYDTRRPLAVNRSFAPYFSRMSYNVDSRKTPAFNSGRLGQHQSLQLAAHKVQQGFIPKPEIK